MKILHIVWSFNFGGIQTLLVDLLNEQVKTHQVSLIIINKNIADDLLNKLSADVKVYKINRKLKSISVFKIIKLNWLIRSINPEKIHCHVHNQIRVLFFIPKRKLSLTVHDVNHPTKYLKRYGKLFAISDAVRNDILKRENLESTVIYNGLNLEKVAVKKDYTTGTLKIIQISRLLHYKKGQDILFHALNHLVYKENFTDFQVSIVGEGESEEYLKELVKELKIGDYVRFLGFKDRNYIYQNLRNYDLLIQPSRYEGFGITVIEAMAAGVPVLVSAIDGPMEITQQGKFGYLFSSENHIQCASQIITIWDDFQNNRIKKKAEEARLNAINRFSIVSTSGKYLNNY